MLNTFFNNDKVRNYLIKHGEVYFIGERNKRPLRERRRACTGNRYDKNITALGFDVMLEVINPVVSAITYKHYLDKSGYGSVEEWKAVVARKRREGKLRLYKATVLPGPAWI